MRAAFLIGAAVALLIANSAVGADSGAPRGIPQRIEVEGLRFPVSGAVFGGVALRNAFPNLTFDRPLAIAHSPADPQRLFVVTQAGVIYTFVNDHTVDEATVFLDLRGRVNSAHAEEGLIGFAMHPDYARNGFFYVHYSAAEPRRAVIARYQVSADPALADPASERILRKFDHPSFNHYAGALAFGPDGMLYVAKGDGGLRVADPGIWAQRLASPLGKILRMRPDGRAPPDNPFIDKPDAHPLVWALGFRNPFRLSFDRLTGELWVGDVGQNSFEEVNVVTAGGNYGWRYFEGNSPYNNPEDLPATRFTPPIRAYDHTEGRAVIGGHVYRGSAIPELDGAYVHADFVTGQIWALRRDAQGRAATLRIAFAPNPSSFGEDPDGELYVLTYGGAILKLEAGAPAADRVPVLLSRTGLFQDLTTLTPAPGLIEYDVIAPLWSDNARKRRWIGVPGQDRIRFKPQGAWAFPQGSVIVKHFELPSGPTSFRRLETRVLLNSEAGWQGFTYRWNRDGTEARLLTEARDETVRAWAPAAPGNFRQQTWHYPGPGECFACHTHAAGFLLGLRSEQMNRPFEYPAATDNQLRALDYIGLFDSSIGDPGQYAALVDPYSPGDRSARARSYLDANCSHCHRPGGPTPLRVDLRATTPMRDTKIRGVAPHDDLGIADALRVAPGDRHRSVLWQRLHRRDKRMPPLASDVVDEAAVRLIGNWIDDGAD